MKLVEEKANPLKIGIGRGLFYYRNFPFWKTFFENLNAEIIVSPETNTQILEKGQSLLTNDVCLPVKAFCGHLFSLTEKCDYLLIPSFYALEKKVYHCPKFIGLPDLMKAVLGKKILILDPDINLEKGKENFYQELIKIASRFITNKEKIKSAIKKAEKVQQDFETLLKEKNISFFQAIEKLFSPEKEIEEKEGNYKAVIGLVGHPYLIYDTHLNHRLLEKLKKQKIKVISPDKIPVRELKETFFKISDQLYWAFEEEILGSSVYFLEKKEINGLICLSAFGCGPDSLIIELLKDYAKKKNKPVLYLTLDEHTAEAGLVTRVEAFIDSLKGEREEREILPPSSPKKRKIKVLGIPSMAEKFSVLRKDFQDKFNITLVTPPVTKKTITLGALYSPQEACLPFKVLLGGFIECLEEKADALLMVTSFNACRMGYYLKVQRKILENLDYQFRFLEMHSKDRGLKGILSLLKGATNNASWSTIIDFLFLAAAKLRIIDEIEKEIYKTRVLEIKKGEADKIYKESLRAVEMVKNIFGLRKIKKEYEEKLKAIPIDKTIKPLKVAIVGELYVVLEPFVNMDLEKELGKRGIMVERIKSSFLSEYTRLFQFNPLEKEKKRLRKLTQPYLKRDVGGHALESLGLKIEYSHKNYDGIIHLMPFTCMPEVIAQNIMIATKEKIPVLTIIYDEELAKAGLITRLEAFIDLLKARKSTNERI